MVLNQARLEHVRNMRLAAQLCMVALCRDVAGRQLVAEMMARRPKSVAGVPPPFFDFLLRVRWEIGVKSVSELLSPFVSNSY